MHLKVLGLSCCLCLVMLAGPGFATRLHPHGHRHGHAHARPHGVAHGGNCVAYARAASGIRIDGDAGAWWRHAEGRYRRGHEPMPGAVLVFRPHGRMWHGHVAVVSRVVNSREILIDHSNWIRGRVSVAMLAVDVSPTNDWTQVKVRSERGGVRANPTFGFIYPRPAGSHGDDIVTAARGEPGSGAAPPPAVRASLRTPAADPDRHARRPHGTRSAKADARHGRAERAEASRAHARDAAEARRKKAVEKAEARRARAREIAEARRARIEASHRKAATRAEAKAAAKTEARRERAREPAEVRSERGRRHALEVAARDTPPERPAVAGTAAR